MAIYTIGVLTYEDVFNDNHSTRFCFFINPATFQKVIEKDKNLVTTVYGWAECSQHNDFD